MSKSSESAAETAVSLLYGPEYYASHCGPVPYSRNDHWLGFFGTVADHLVRAFAPRRVYDAGCAIGLLVESLWDRGVEAHGRDISEWAISQVRPDIRPWCQVGSIAEPVEGEFDLATCIEVVEHMAPEAARDAIRVLAAAAPRILFSSSPTDFDEPTHVNVRPTAYWLRLWAEAGFAPDVTHDAGYLAPHAYILERSDNGRSERDLIAFADRIRHRVALSQVGGAMFAARSEAADLRARLASTESQAASVAAARVAAELQRDANAAERSATETLLAAAKQQLAQEQSRVASLEAETEASRLAWTEARLEADGLTAGTTVLADSLAQVRTELNRKDAELRELAHASETARSAAEHQIWIARSELQSVTSSTIWRATRVLRSGGRLVPQRFRRGLRLLPRLLIWTVTLQLPARMRARRDLRARLRLLASTPLFDPNWYAARNPDVAISGIPAGAHYAWQGGAEGRDPGPQFSVSRYLAAYPESATFPGGPLFHALAHNNQVGGEHGPAAGLSGSIPEPLPLLPLMAAEAESGRPVTIPEGPPQSDSFAPGLETILAGRFRDLSALPIYAAPSSGRRRLTVVTDSVSPGSLYGGVGTALVFAALAATRLDAGLRLTTRIEPADGATIASVLEVHGIPWTGNIEILHAPRGGDGPGRDVPSSPEDVFLTTSWWTTWATRQSVPRSRISYLLQEDERMFYPYGDDHLRCSETLSDPDVLYLVNSGLLLEHFRAEGLAPGAVAFEPSFPRSVYHPGPARTGKRNLFFYARPYNARNMYWRGLEALNAAIEEGVLDPQDWEFHFAGHGAEHVALPRGAVPRFPGLMDWKQYATFIRTIDVGLSLMYTPHPSYPPLDLAAVGAVVVTNRFGVKQSLDEYSQNIICTEPDVSSLVEGLRRATILSADMVTRSAYFEASRLQRDWAVSMLPALDRIATWAAV